MTDSKLRQKNSNQHGRGPGASIYLTQHEIEILLEAADMLRNDYSDSEIFEQIQFELLSAEKKLLARYIP